MSALALSKKTTRAPAPTEPEQVVVRAAATRFDWRRSRALLIEYLTWLAEAADADPFQVQPELRQECRALPTWYSPPGGRMLLATLGGELVGQVGVLTKGAGIAELRRLYVRPSARGRRVGERLVRASLAAASALGCQAARLTTLPGLMDPAVAIYRRVGFEPIQRYNDLAVDGLLYLERRLDQVDDPAA